jgi:hypothetical protein
MRASRSATARSPQGSWSVSIAATIRASTAGASGARLIWGKNIEVPAQPDEGGPLFMLF